MLDEFSGDDYAIRHNKSKFLHVLAWLRDKINPGEVCLRVLRCRSALSCPKWFRVLSQKRLQINYRNTCQGPLSAACLYLTEPSKALADTQTWSSKLGYNANIAGVTCFMIAKVCLDLLLSLGSYQCHTLLASNFSQLHLPYNVFPPAACFLYML